ncbi:hypothetical protein JD77_00341 [Micromonospora olivasterospora]|uniref:Uncharacterized protein n=1 Tax=Micromonospora olivasterospora TaxID=1880 RepID=A0A562I3X0_MICOL|nr:hypothetical protein JD77_00341 [Micromonospora olivasterospora]
MPPAFARRESLLQHPPRGDRVAGLPVQPGQQVRAAQHLRVVLAVACPEWAERIGQEAARAGEVAGGSDGECLMLEGGQGRGL